MRIIIIYTLYYNNISSILDTFVFYNFYLKEKVINIKVQTFFSFFL